MNIRKFVGALGLGFFVITLTFFVSSHGARAAAPDTSILSGPDTLTLSTGAGFEFESSDLPATFECSLDGAAFTACTSPYSSPTLTAGEHTFSVRAISAGDEADASPAVATWTVVAFAGGDGSSGDPYQIEDCTDLEHIAVNPSLDFVITKDIDCAGVTMTPIAPYPDAFTGSLDGGNHIISNATITDGATFGIISSTQGAHIHDLEVWDSSFSGESGGAVVGYADLGTQLTNIRVLNTTVTSTNGYVGGIAAFFGNSCVMTKSSFVGGSVSSAGHVYVGGLVSENLGSSQIIDSFSRTTITGDKAGGIAGTMGDSLDTMIVRSYSASTFPTLSTYTGGLVGWFEGGTVQDSFSVSDMTVGGGSSIGGLFGYGYGTSTNNFFDQTKAGLTKCSGTGTATCTTVNAGNAHPNYFINNKTNAPLDTWDFGPSKQWHVNYNEYPTLTPVVGPEMLCEMPVQTFSTIHAACDYFEHGWGTTTWEAQYQANGANDWTPVTLDDIHVGSATVAGTSPFLEYNIRFRYTNDSGTSDWGKVLLVQSDADGDGVNDLVESSGPNGGDANNDGISDATQANVYTTINPVDGKYLVVVTSTCANNFNVQVGGESSEKADASYSYPTGLVGFVGRSCGAAGSSVTASLYFFGDYDPAMFVLRKWDTNGSYATIDGATLSSVTIGGDKALLASYVVVDGGALDQDGVADGNIVDPVGLASAVVVAPSTGLRHIAVWQFVLALVLGLSAVAYVSTKSYFEKRAHATIK